VADGGEIMSVDIQGQVNDIRVSAIHSDPKLGTWWAFATEKEYVEIRTTKTGMIRVFEVKKEKHPYFTPPTNNNE
jgi:ribosomal protein L31